MYQKIKENETLQLQPSAKIISLLEAKRQEIKSGLQECNKGLNKGKQREKEYALFLQLGDTYLQGDILDYPKASAIYQYLNKMLETAFLTDKEEKSIIVKNRITSVEEKFVGQINTQGIRSISIEQYQKELEGIRNWVKQELLKIADLGVQLDIEELKTREELYTEIFAGASKLAGSFIEETNMNEKELKLRSKRVEKIYRDIKKFFIGEQGLIRRLIDDCINQLGGLPQVNKDGRVKPCEHAAFGVGSMSIGTITPWSDLEFGMLIEDGLSEQDEKTVKEYFRNVTTLLNIKIIKFGETPLRMVGVKELNNFRITEKLNAEHNWFFDDLTSSGFSFDGPHWHACKTPLGRTEGYNKLIKNENGVEEAISCEPYELIGTVSELMEFHNPERSWHKGDKELVQALGHVVLMHGSEGLISAYRKQLSIGKYKEVAEKCAFEILKKNSENLNPKKQIFDMEKEGEILNVKMDIYRFPDRVIVSFGDCLEERAEDSWTLIKQLVAGGKITAEGALNLELALSIAAEMRLGTYANNNGQREDVSALARYETKLKELQAGESVVEAFYIKYPKILYRYYYTIMPLAEATTEATNLEDLQRICKEEDFYTNELSTKGLIYKRFLRYEEAIKEFEAGLQLLNIMGASLEKTERTAAKMEITFFLADLYYKVGKYEQALAYQQKNISIVSNMLVDNQGNRQMYLMSLKRMVKLLTKLDQYESALQYLQKALEIERMMYEEDHVCLVESLHGIGVLFYKLSKYDEALKYCQESLHMQHRINKGNHFLTLMILNTMGSVFSTMGRYEEALLYHKASLAIANKLYKGAHAQTAMCLANIGKALIFLARYEDALIYCQENLNIQKEIYKDDHDNIALVLQNMGVVLACLDRFEEAYSCYKEALEMQRRIFKGDNTDIMRSLINIGGVLQRISKYDEALAHYQEGLEIARSIHKGDHSDVAAALNNIGIALEKLGRYDEALIDHKDSLDMRRRLYKADHAEIADSLHNIGGVLHRLGEFEEALAHTHESLAMYRNIFKREHESIVRSLNNVASTLNSLKRWEEALAYGLESLDMARKLFGDVHSAVATALYTVGSSLQWLGKFEEALVYYHESLAMERSIYKGDHSEIARTLGAIGTKLSDQGKYEEALVYYQDTLSMHRRLFKGDHRHLELSVRHVADTLDKLEKYEEALLYYEESLEMQRRIHKGDHTEVATSLYYIGALLFGQLFRDEEALKYSCEALEMWRRLYHKEAHINLVNVLDQVGAIHDRLNQSEEALRYRHESIETLKKLPETEQRRARAVRCLNNMGDTLRRLFKFKEALHYYQKGLKSAEELGNGAEIANSKGIIEKLTAQLVVHGKLKTMMGRLFNRNNTAVAMMMPMVRMLAGQFGDSEQMMSYILKELASEFWQNNNCTAAIGCYELLIKEKLCTTQETTVRHNLACLYHVKALEEQSNGQKEKFKEYIDKAKMTFENAINTSLGKAALYAEYAMFLFKYYNTDNIEESNKIESLLKKVIKLDDDGSGLSYNQLEKATVAVALQELLQTRHTLNIKPHILAYYLLISVYNANNKKKEAEEALEIFKAIAVSLKGKPEEDIAQYLVDYIHRDSAYKDEITKAASSEKERQEAIINIASPVGQKANIIFSGVISYQQANNKKDKSSITSNQEGSIIKAITTEQTCDTNEEKKVAILNTNTLNTKINEQPVANTIIKPQMPESTHAVKDKSTEKHEDIAVKPQVDIPKSTISIQAAKESVEKFFALAATKEIEDNKQALKKFLKTIAGKEQIYGLDDLKVALLYMSIGTILQAQDEHIKAIGNFLKSFEIYKKICNKEHPQMLACQTAILKSLSPALRQLTEGIKINVAEPSKYDKLLQFASKLLVTLEELPDSRTDVIIMGYEAIAGILKAQGNYGKATEYYLKALAGKEKMHGPNHSDIINLLDNIGFTLREQGKYSKALGYFFKVLAANKNASAYSAIGFTLCAQNRYEEAIEYYLKCLAISEQVSDQVYIAISYNGIGKALYGQNQYEKAMEYYLKSIAIVNNISKVIKQVMSAKIYDNIGLLLKAQSKYAEAMEYYIKSLTIREASDNPDIIKSYNNSGILLREQGKHAEAIEHFLKALTIARDKKYHPNHPDFAMTYSNIGSTLKSQGRNKEAMEYFLKSLSVHEKLYGIRHLQTLICKDEIIKLTSLEAEVADKGRDSVTITNVIKPAVQEKIDNAGQKDSSNINELPQPQRLGHLLSAITSPIKINIKCLLTVIVPFSQMQRMAEYRAYSAIFTNNDIILRIFYYTYDISILPDITCEALPRLLRAFVEKRVVTNHEQQNIVGLKDEESLDNPIKQRVIASIDPASVTSSVQPLSSTRIINSIEPITPSNIKYESSTALNNTLYTQANGEKPMTDVGSSIVELNHTPQHHIKSILQTGSKEEEIEVGYIAVEDERRQDKGWCKDCCIVM